MFSQPTIIVATLLAMLTPALAFDLQAHRGGRGLMPENTLPAFANALTMGVTTLELDTAITKDGVVVVSHNPILDKTLARDKDGNWLKSEPLIKTLTFKQIQTYKMGKLKPGSRNEQRFDKQKQAEGARIPSLEQVFELVKKSGNQIVRFNIETKLNPEKPDDTVSPEIFVKALLHVINENKMASRVAIQSFDWRTLQIVQKSNPEIETVYLTAQEPWLNNVTGKNGKASKWTAGFNINDHGGNVVKLIKAAGGDVWSPYQDGISVELIDEAHKLGLKVIPWTLNNEETMAAFIGIGVDGIITDYPDMLREVMKKQGVKLPAPTPVSP